MPRCFREAFFLSHIHTLYMVDHNVPVRILRLFAYQTLTLSRVPIDGAQKGQSRRTTLGDSTRAVDAER